ncbi:MAG: hypothetical protein EBZ03_11085, partial [Betaproteobacteria bacterium]|nr:hypothetical protein [Betaproteobacteria bacterium]
MRWICRKDSACSTARACLSLRFQQLRISWRLRPVPFGPPMARMNGHEQAQNDLIAAHPELAAKAAIAGQLTDASRAEQTRSGLQACSPEEFEAFHELKRQYRERFGWPFILAIG